MTLPLRRHLFVALAALVLSACGFHLRGNIAMPFHTVYLAGDENNAVLVDLRRQLRLNDVEVVDTAPQAEAVIRVIQLRKEKDILSLNAAGKAREYRLFYTLAYAVDTPTGKTLRAPDRIILRRDITFDDSQVLAKAQEETLLYNDMENDLIQQLMRRLATIKLDTAQ
ncbi:hypothetical protein G3580_15695 [Nitrogeniibacter mangrovi]|uniref:LPS-assembly lipoprotein LptE n=1 Tax=Nitrogeniibacter mangrovi TaxID=2016596 RepID=A0A6C1B655_9RHOO|nr:LPS assembly lipoprotein LptE [Nitrogeniibacter mangrovi]QID18937.1 hypothetical protein G3580_15695 [Nitrogeniibacter mangrovi]